MLVQRIMVGFALLAGLMFSMPGVAVAKDLKGWGIVVMHGKGGRPGSMTAISSALTAAGALVASPTMSWSSGYQTYTRTLDEVAGHIASLRAKGATRIALVGQSLGANVALGYGAQRGGVQAIAALAPGHRPEGFIRKSGDSLARAKQAVAAGRGSEVGSYFDSNQGRDFQVQTTAAAYVSFFDPAGPAVMSRNAASLKGGSLLWVIGTGDAGAQSVARGGKIITVPGSHFDTPKVAAPHVVAWLESL
jgi:pimeloyl-ACP methyl ester carboxylesterase